MTPPSPAFDLLNPEGDGPVLLSVPHAGRDYLPEHRQRIRPPVERLLPLEDRLVDEVVRGETHAPLLIARRPRAWIDLNRHEAEIDPGLVDGAVASRLMLTPKVRNGLGLIPRRLAAVGEIWRGRLSKTDVESRLASVHRPYHAEIRRLLAEFAARYGTAILLDVHSMPPLAAHDGRPAARVVIGNRFGQSAAPWLTACIAATCVRFGLPWRENSPYAGGHIIERHGSPARGVHAIQLEIDRSLYLDASFLHCDPERLASTRRFVAQVVKDLSDAALDSALPLAAE